MCLSKEKSMMNLLENTPIDEKVWIFLKMIFWENKIRLYLRNAIQFMREAGQVKNIDEWGLKKRLKRFSSINVFAEKVIIDFSFWQTHHFNSRPSRLASGVHFPTVLTMFKTALVSIIFILELSVLHKSCLELNFRAKRTISRVPCTPVFLRSRTSNFQYWIF